MNSSQNDSPEKSPKKSFNEKSVSVLLNDLTQALKSHQLWQVSEPAPEKLASTLPFCYDTLAFEQWLQFIFIPKILHMVNQGLPLPRAISLTPMAQEAFKNLGDKGVEVTEVISTIDQLLSKPLNHIKKEQ